MAPEYCFMSTGKELINRNTKGDNNTLLVVYCSSHVDQHTLIFVGKEYCLKKRGM